MAIPEQFGIDKRVRRPNAMANKQTKQGRRENDTKIWGEIHPQSFPLIIANVTTPMPAVTSAAPRNSAAGRRPK
jgi:hypothetical protein